MFVFFSFQRFRGAPPRPLRDSPLGDSPAGVGLSFLSNFYISKPSSLNFPNLGDSVPPLFYRISTSRFLASVRGLTPLNFGSKFFVKQGTTPISRICVNCESLVFLDIFRKFYLITQSWYLLSACRAWNRIPILNPAPQPLLVSLILPFRSPATSTRRSPPRGLGYG